MTKKELTKIFKKKHNYIYEQYKNPTKQQIYSQDENLARLTTLTDIFADIMGIPYYKACQILLDIDE